ncbi:hypothetical protein [Dysgonomonas capnocytophagoides]|uniref:hypothetical protein n=1 Tax=Dysgonomonas capnocytophagoides TaxID=45254 RepID=UPI003995CEE2
MQVADIIKLVEELTETKQELAKLQKELDKIYAARLKRAEAAKKKNKVSPEDKKFSEVLRCSLVRLGTQHYQDVVTTKEIIKEIMIKQDCSEYDFYSRFNNAIARLLNYKIFVDECNALDPEAVAQHVILRGDTAINKVFKSGLKTVFDDAKLGLMDKIIFSKEELEISQYKKKFQNPREVLAEEPIN